MHIELLYVASMLPTASQIALLDRLNFLPDGLEARNVSDCKDWIGDAFELHSAGLATLTSGGFDFTRVQITFAGRKWLSMNMYCPHGNTSDFCEVCHPELESDADREVRLGTM